MCNFVSRGHQVINGQMQRRKLTIHRNLFSLVGVKSHIPESCEFCLGSGFVKCLQISAQGVAFHIQEGKVTLLGLLRPKLTSFRMWPDVSSPNGCVRNIRHTQVFKCLVKRRFDLLGHHRPTPVIKDLKRYKNSFGI
jgi:hypothetical protein